MNETIVSLQKKANPLNVLFVNLPTNSPELLSSNDVTSENAFAPPLGLLYLANSIQDCSFVSSYQCADFRIANMSGCSEKNHLVEFVNRKLKKTATNQPDVVAVSLIFSSAYYFFQIVIEYIL